MLTSVYKSLSRQMPKHAESCTAQHSIAQHSITTDWRSLCRTLLSCKMMLRMVPIKHWLAGVRACVCLCVSAWVSACVCACVCASVSAYVCTLVWGDRAPESKRRNSRSVSKCASGLQAAAWVGHHVTAAGGVRQQRRFHCHPPSLLAVRPPLHLLLLFLLLPLLLLLLLSLLMLPPLLLLWVTRPRHCPHEGSMTPVVTVLCTLRIVGNLRLAHMRKHPDDVALPFCCDSDLATPGWVELPLSPGCHSRLPIASKTDPARIGWALPPPAGLQVPVTWHSRMDGCQWVTELSLTPRAFCHNKVM